MRLTQFSNFAVRILMYAGLKGPSPRPIPEIARAYGISHDHLKKAAAELSRLGYLAAVRGRSGGVSLAIAPEAISIGEVVRKTEGTTTLIECFDPATSRCPLHADCRFRTALQQAQEAFFAVLDRHMLSDLIKDRERLVACIDIEGIKPPDPRPSPVPLGCRRMTNQGSAVI